MIAGATVKVGGDHSSVVLSQADDPDLRAALQLAGFDARRAAGGRLVIPLSNTAALLEKTQELGYPLHWTPQAVRFAENRRLAFERHPRLAKDIRELDLAGAREALSDLADQEVLDSHQLVNVAALASDACYGLCVFDEQGAGKTVSVIYGWDVLASRRQADLMVVIAPKSMVPEWASDIERFRPTLYRIETVDGPRPKKLRQLGRRFDIAVVGYEALVSLEPEVSAVIARRKTILVVDESFAVKNPEAIRTGAVKRIREWAERCWVLCGTPAPNAPQDIRAQVDLADLGVAFSGVSLPEDREEAAPVVREILRQKAVYRRSLKADVLPDLPEKRFRVVNLTMEPEQRSLYERLRSGLAEDLAQTDDASFERERLSFMARRSAMLQVCSHPTAVDPSYAGTPAKLSATRAVVSQRVADGEKVVVWSFFTHSLDALVKVLSPFNPVRYDGSVSSAEERRAAVAAFQEDDSTMVFIGNPAAAGAGLTLTASRCAVYESFSNQAAHHLQSLDRVHRRGQRRPVDYIVLLCGGTIEVAEYQRLLVKEREARDLLADRILPPLTRESLLEEILEPHSDGQPLVA